MFFVPTNIFLPMTPLIMRTQGLLFFGPMLTLFRKPLHSPPNGKSQSQTLPMKKHLKSRNLALDIPRYHEAVATDTIFSDTPSVDSGLNKLMYLLVGTL